MSPDTPGIPDMDDDLDPAYTRAHALADDGRGPSASVRANVLAAARDVAAQATAKPALVPVAPPVAAIGRGGPSAVNRSSWRVRSGAAACAALIVGLASWHFEAGRVSQGEQVASASLELAAPPTVPLARDLPVPPLSGASYPYAAPPPVVEEPVDRVAEARSAKLAKRESSGKDLIVAQAEESGRSPRSAAPPDAPARRAPPAAPQAPTVAANASADAAAPVVVASNAPEQAPTTVTITGPSATPFATTPAMPPSVLQRRVAVVPPSAAAPAAKPAPRDEPTTVAATDAQRVEVTGVTLSRVDDASRKSSLLQSSLGMRARLLPPPLQSAADRGDVEGLRKLLADPAERVDAPDAAGRSALLYAVLAQHPDAVRLLIAAGADPDRADPAGLTPRAAARAGANAEIAALLAARR